MNKKTVVLIVAFIGCLVPFYISAQEIKVTKSPETFTGAENEVDFVIAGQAENNLYVYKRLEKSIELYKFDRTTLKLVDKKEISFKLRQDATKTRTPDLNKVLVLKDHIVIFTDLYYKGDNESSLYAKRFDFNLNPVKDWQKIEYINTEISAHPGMFLITPSADSSKILIVKTETITNNKGNEKLSFTVINSKLSWVSGKDQELKYPDTRTNVTHYKIGNNGTVYMVVKTDDEKQAGYKLCRFTLNNSNEYITNEFDLQLPGKKTADITCELSATGDLLVTGFYAENPEQIQGVFWSWLVNNSTTLSAFNFGDLPNSVSNKPVIDKVNILEKNSFELFAEERYQDAGTHTAYLNAVHYFKVDNTGISSHNTLTKLSHTKEGPAVAFLSYFAFTGNGVPLLFYNEHKKNLGEGAEYKELVAEQKDNKRVLIGATLADNKTGREEVLREGDEGYGFVPRYALQISPTEILMLGKRYENFVLYKLTVESKQQLVSGH